MLSNLLKPQKESQSVNQATHKLDKICLLAGSDHLPEEIIKSAKQNNISLCVIAIDGHVSCDLSDIVHITVKLGQVGKMLDFLKKHNISKICFAGSVKRPSISDLKLDMAAVKFLAKSGIKKLSGGDDKLLNLLVEFLAENNVTLIGPEEIAPEILADNGCITSTKPSQEDCNDIELGEKILNSLSQYDIGQAIIIENQYVVGIEAAEGTDNLIKRIKDLKKEKKYGVLVKKPKTNQNLKVDLPTIGIRTIQNSIESGLKGIAISAGKTIVINKNELVKLANKHKFFIIGV